MPAPAPGPFRRLLVPVDFSPPSEAAWAVARRLAGAVGAEVVLLHVTVEAPLYAEGPFTGARARDFYAAARAWAEKTLEQWAAAARAEGLAVRALVRAGVPHREILAVAGEAGIDLIVIGTHGRGGLERALIGSVADRVVRLAACPVLTVRAGD